MRIFVAGGSGTIGRQLVPLLVAEGHEVVASARSSAKLAEISSWGADAALMEGLDLESVRAAITAARPEVVVHQMTALAGLANLRHFDREFAVTNRLRVEGTRHLLQAAAETGVRRLIAQSFTGWTNERGGSPIKDENCPLDPEPRKSMRRSLEAIGQLETMLTDAAGVDGVVLRYGHIYGPGAPGFLEAVRQHKLPVVGDGAGSWSFTHVADAAQATALALDHGGPGMYNVVDDEAPPAAEWIPYLAEAVGAKPPMHVPAWVGKLAAGEAVVSMMTQSRGSSNAKAKALLGWAPRHPSWREGFRSWATDGQVSESREAA